METLIEETISERFNPEHLTIKVDYEYIRTYQITLICKHLPIESGLLTKTIVFSYNWTNNFMFSNNIEQLYYEIVSMLKKEGVWYYVK